MKKATENNKSKSFVSLIRRTNSVIKKGFTMIELMVVISIAAILSMAVTTNVISFQDEAKINAATEEFASVLETARNRSVNGEVPKVAGEFDQNNMPFWSVDMLSATQYRLTPKCKLTDGTDCPPGDEIFNLKNGVLNPPTASVEFKRLSGKTSATSFTITGNSITKSVNVDNNGFVSIQVPTP